MTLASLASLGDQPLRWTKSDAAPRRYELAAHGSDVVATLQWARSSGSLATLQTAAGTWTLKRTGFLSPRITVRKPGHPADVAVFIPSGWGGSGTLAISGGGTYHWRHHGLWRQTHSFHALSDEPLVTVGPAAGWLHRSADVALAPAARSSPDADLLAGLAWYLVLMGEEDAAMVAASSGVLFAACS
ncbi:MAG: hypothetical protein SFZ24_07850 [Planctomycetota bacterium]|nr:hypothetical protein [Planctomycetota bacterium]